MRVSLFIAIAAPLVQAIPAPAPVSAPAPTPVSLPSPRDIIGNPVTGLLSGLVTGILDIGNVINAVPALITDLEGVIDAANQVQDAIRNGSIAGTDVPVIVRKLYQAVQPTSTPTSIPQAISEVASLWNISSIITPPAEQNILANALGLVLNGFTSSDLQALVAESSLTTNGDNNTNPTVPTTKSFYTKAGNAPFSVPEAQLRAAIYIPPSFTYGKKQPILMSPGTGVTGSSAYQATIGKLLSTTTFADPVYLNVPNALLSDIQINAEYVSYALQYIYALTSVKPAIITWSQGSLDAQWAFKYWPSLPSIVTDHIAISPDYHGTILAYLLCPGFSLLDAVSCAPAVFQQDYASNFINQLRKTNGDSAYLPTTTIYSATDEIVEPQDGTAASGYLNDVRAVGVSNTFLQGACLGLPAAGLYTHEGVLYNPITYALIIDALLHDGPGDFSRVAASCGDVVTPGLSLEDVILTEALIPQALFNMLAYEPKALVEPAIKPYATY